MNAAPMRLEFYEWHCGERDHPPESIDGLTLERAISVMKALSAALEQDASCRARLIDDAGDGAQFHITPRRVIAT